MGNPKIHLDRNLIVRIKNGDLQAFNQLYEIFKPTLIAFTNRYTKNTSITEEIVQEVFVTLWEKHQSINEELSFNSFLFTITQNKINDYFRKTKTEILYKNYVQTFVGQSDSESLNHFINSNFNLQLNQVIKRLPEKRKMVLILSKKFGLSREEIARFMNISENTAKNQLFEAIQFIKEHLNTDVLITLFALIINLI